MRSLDRLLSGAARCFRHLRKPRRWRQCRLCGKAQRLQLLWFSACGSRPASPRRSGLRCGPQDLRWWLGCHFCRCSCIGRSGRCRSDSRSGRKAVDAPVDPLDIRWAFILAAVWLAASAFRAGELAFHALRLRRLWKVATPVGAGVEIDSRVREMLTAVSNSRRIEICTTRDLDCPSVIGFFAPRILIPEWLFSRLTPGELEQVVLHETEHLRRRDDWTNLLQKLSLVLFPLNPALAWMERRLCREREMACDEGVIRRTQAPRAYAACLTTLAERGLQQRELLRRAHALSLGAFTRRPELVHRVHSILRRKQALNPLVAGALVGVVGFGLVIGARWNFHAARSWSRSWRRRRRTRRLQHSIRRADMWGARPPTQCFVPASVSIRERPRQ